MKTDTILWLLPIMFMIHDFEEIIFFRRWGESNIHLLDDRVPVWLRRVMNSTLTLSTSAFASAVACLFLSLSAFTWLCVENHWLTLWMGMLLVYAAHLIAHIVSAAYLQRVTPALVTSLLTLVYAGYAFLAIRSHPLYEPSRLGYAVLVTAIGSGLILVASVNIARKLDEVYLSVRE